MAEEKSLFVKLAVPVTIIGLGTLSLIFAFFGWVNPPAANEQSNYVIPACRILSVICVFFTAAMLIGVGAKRAGYKQEELDRWGDEALYGKPPI